MDPYLEAQGRWRDLHARLITYSGDALSQVLPENYVAQIEQQVRLVSPEAVTAVLYPDLLVGHGSETAPPPVRAQGAGTLTIEPVTVPLLKGELEEVRDTWIEIVRLPDLEFVTVIEILSPANKTGAGRVEYLDKRDGLIDQSVNLVVLDLLSGGRRLPMKKPMPAGDYFALVARAERRPDCDVYAWSIRQPLPTIPIPLNVPDSDLLLNLFVLEEPEQGKVEARNDLATVEIFRPGQDLDIGRRRVDVDLPYRGANDPKSPTPTTLAGIFIEQPGEPVGDVALVGSHWR